jgi:hypothetical protein
MSGSMIHFLARGRQYEVAENSGRGAKKVHFSVDFSLCSMNFGKVKEKMRDLG